MCLELATGAGQNIAPTVGSVGGQTAVSMPEAVGGCGRAAEAREAEMYTVLPVSEQDGDCGTISMLCGMGLHHQRDEIQSYDVYKSSEAMDRL